MDIKKKSVSIHLCDASSENKNISFLTKIDNHDLTIQEEFYRHCTTTFSDIGGIEAYEKGKIYLIIMILLNLKL
jgi:hypothetical protein